MNYKEFTGKTVEEAIENGLKELGLARENADIRVLEEGKKKLFGSVKARVEIAKKEEETVTETKATEKTSATAVETDMTDGERTVEGAYVGDLLSWVMGRAESGNVWITIMSNINIVAVASLADVACIILAEGVELDENVCATALQKGINIYTSEKTAYQLAATLAECLQ